MFLVLHVHVPHGYVGRAYGVVAATDTFIVISRFIVGDKNPKKPASCLHEGRLEAGSSGCLQKARLCNKRIQKRLRNPTHNIMSPL